MPKQTATASGADLSAVLTSALADLVDDDDVVVEARIPEGIDVADIRIEVEAAVQWDDDDDEGAGDDGGSDDAAQDDAVAGAAATEQPTTPASSSRVDDGAPGVVDDADVAESTGTDGAPTSLSEEELEELDEEADAGADFVEGLLDAMDLPGELKIRVIEEPRRAEVEVVDMNSGALIGRRGSTLEAIQELMRCALQSQFERRVHVHVDVEGYRARRLEKLLDKADEAIDDVLDSGESERLEPMDVFERKAIHEFVNTVEGVVSRSQGREPSRRVVIELAD